MRLPRPFLALLIFITMAGISGVLPQVQKAQKITQGYGVTTCPGPVNGARGTALLPSRSVGVRELERKNSEFSKSPLGTRSLYNGALVVQGDPRSTITLQTKPGKWTSAVTCSSGESTTWFVGGTANVSSQGKLILINSGLSDATVEVTAYSELGPQQPSTFTINALSERAVKIDTLNPGAQKLTLRVEVVSGRVTSFMVDERVRGLSNNGGDYVSPIYRPSESLIIAGLPTRFGDGSKISHTLRIMTVSDSDATASVELISQSGVFVPVGLGEIEMNSREVMDLPIDAVDIGSKPFALKITASQPIVASVLTEVRRGSVSDFMWLAPSPSFNQIGFNLYGLEPFITFVGEKVRVDVEWRTRAGKVRKESLSGSEIVNWRVPADTRLVTIINKSDVRAGMAWITNDGVAHIPLLVPTSLESAPLPIADISVIQSRT